MKNSTRKQEKNIDYLESRYLYEYRQKLYIANEEINQVFDETDIPEFIEFWEQGRTFEYMAEYFGYDKWEMYLLAIDLMRAGKIHGEINFDRGAGNV